MHTRLHGTEYLTRTVSDHNPLPTRLHWGAQQPEALENQVFLHEIRGHIVTYFAENAQSTDSRVTEWEAFKAVMLYPAQMS